MGIFGKSKEEWNTEIKSLEAQIAIANDQLEAEIHGREKAEREQYSLKQQLGDAKIQKEALSERIADLTSALEAARQKIAELEERLSSEKADRIREFDDYRQALIGATKQAKVCEIDRRGFEIICRQAYPWACSVEMQDKNIVIMHESMNEFSHTLKIVLPSDIRVERLSQLGDILKTREFPELTEALRLERGLGVSLKVKYLPFRDIHWEKLRMSSPSVSAWDIRKIVYVDS